VSETKVTITLVEPFSFWRSALSNLNTVATMTAIFAIGWWFDSTAMQWFGFIVAMLVLFARAAKLGHKFTPQEASDFLKAEYSVSPATQTRGER
jgi:hypothetical protein